MITADILSFIPQRHPFVMIDKLLFVDEVTSRTEFIITAENIFCDEEKFLEAGMLENIAQTAAAGAGYRASINNKPVTVGYIGAVKNFEVYNMPAINDQLFTEVTITNKIFHIMNVEGKITCNNAVMAQCEMKIFIESND